MSIKEALFEHLKKISSELGAIEVGFDLVHSKNLSHGDYASNVALVIGKVLGKNPLEVAKKIQAKFPISKAIRKIEIAAPGFINFFLSENELGRQLKEALSMRDNFGMSTKMKDKKIMIEFTDPNPFKEFHIGHLYSNTVGESFSRLAESQGATVWRVTYQGDIGLHVAKAIWGILNQELQIKNLEDRTPREKAKFLGEAYVHGSRMYEEDTGAKEKINEINMKIYEASDESITEWYKKGREWSLKYFETMYQRLGSKFVKNYFESVAGPIGLRLVKSHIQDKIFKESDGAVIFEGEKYGLHNRVFINSLGLPTYEAKDMGLPQTKYKDFEYDASIIITGEEQSAYFQVVLKALSLLNPELAAKTKHIAHGVVRLPEGKMSSRKGNVLTGEWLLDETKSRIRERYPSMDEEALEMVAVGAVKYALLRSGIGKNIEFNLNESISFEGNSGPYVQYAFARTQSVLAKAGNNHKGLRMNDALKLNLEEEVLLRLLYRFAEVVEMAAIGYAPSVLCEYLFELAQSFSLFYQKHKILESQHREFRLALTQAVGQVLKNGLSLLGIKAPEKM